MNYGILIDQAYGLYTKLNNAAYTASCAYSRYPSSALVLPELDVRLARLNGLIGRAERRTLRRMNVRRQIRGY